MSLFLGTAGWTIPKLNAVDCPGEGTHLQRYSQIFPCAEINSSFHRPHRESTWAKWADAVPENFRFAVKVPRTITHEGQLLATTKPLLLEFLQQSSALGARRGPLLLQCPPKLELNPRTATPFFKMFRKHYEGPAAFEPRHASWFTAAANALLQDFRIARVAADPALNPEAAHPAGHAALIYYRLHGSPRRYYSSYAPEYLQQLSAALRFHAENSETWCIFDNTASGAALGNLIDIQRLVGAPSLSRSDRVG